MYKIIIASFIIISMVVIGCKKDKQDELIENDPITEINYLQFEDSVYDLHSCVIINRRIANKDSLYHYEIRFFSKGIETYLQFSEIAGYVGEGVFFAIDAYCLDSIELLDGEYLNISHESGGLMVPDSYSIHNGILSTNWSIEEQNYQEIYNPKLLVEKTDSNYVFNFEGYVNYNSKIVLNFQNSVIFFGPGYDL